MIMPLTIEQAREHKRAFDRTYFLSQLYGNYTRGTGLVTLREHIAELERKGIKDLPKTDGISLDDYCLVVTLREEPPKNVSYPDSYGSLMIFYYVEKWIGF